jgi:hypothetical protein
MKCERSSGTRRRQHSSGSSHGRRPHRPAQRRRQHQGAVVALLGPEAQQFDVGDLAHVRVARIAVAEVEDHGPAARAQHAPHLGGQARRRSSSRIEENTVLALTRSTLLASAKASSWPRCQRTPGAVRGGPARAGPAAARCRPGGRASRPSRSAGAGSRRCRSRRRARARPTGPCPSVRPAARQRARARRRLAHDVGPVPGVAGQRGAAMPLAIDIA